MSRALAYYGVASPSPQGYEDVVGSCFTLFLSLLLLQPGQGHVLGVDVIAVDRGVSLAVGRGQVGRVVRRFLFLRLNLPLGDRLVLLLLEMHAHWSSFKELEFCHWLRLVFKSTLSKLVLLPFMQAFLDISKKTQG